ncbi:MAG: hypothetical protein D6725_01245, partial [Planctomycetota bacterium]
FKSALIFCVADTPSPLLTAARRLLALEALAQEADELQLEDDLRQQLQQRIQRVSSELKESVWRVYRHVCLLEADGTLRRIDLGLTHSSAAESLPAMILDRLEQVDLVARRVSPEVLVRNWPPAKPEWTVRDLRDAFFASPRLPRLRQTDTLRETIAEGVRKGRFAYAVRGTRGDDFQRFEWAEHRRPKEAAQPLQAHDVEFSDHAVLLTREAAQQWYAETTGTAGPAVSNVGGEATETDAPPPPTPAPPMPQPPPTGEPTATFKAFRWSGIVPSTKWMNFYNGVLARFINRPGCSLKLRVEVEVQAESGLTSHELEAVRSTLLDFNLPDQIETVSADDQPPSEPSPSGTSDRSS